MVKHTKSNKKLFNILNNDNPNMLKTQMLYSLNDNLKKKQLKEKYSVLKRQIKKKKNKLNLKNKLKNIISHNFESKVNLKPRPKRKALTINCIKKNNDLLLNHDLKGSKPSKGLLISTNKKIRIIENKECLDDSKIKSPSKSINSFTINQYTSLLLLKSNEKCQLEGVGFISSLHGTAEVFGYVIDPTINRLPVYSYPTHSFLSVKAISNSDDTINLNYIKNKLNLKYKIFLLSNIHDNLSKLISENEVMVVLLLERIDDFLIFWNHLQTFNVYKNIFNKDFTSAGLCAQTSNANSFVCLDEHEKVANIWTDHILKGYCPVVIICGGKNTGKSSLIRYLINKALNVTSSIAYLECDVGQTEFVPPGCMSMNIISSPIFGAPFTHQMQSLRTCFYGSVSPSSNYKHYLKCLKFVYQGYRDVQGKCPLIVNTMGWNTGMGVSLFLNTLKMVMPTILIQLNSSKKKANYPCMHHDMIKTLEQNHFSFKEQKSNASIEYLYFPIDLPFNFPSATAKIYLPPVEHRNLSLLSYFLKNNPYINTNMKSEPNENNVSNKKNELLFKLTRTSSPIIKQSESVSYINVENANNLKTYNKDIKYLTKMVSNTSFTIDDKFEGQLNLSNFDNKSSKMNTSHIVDLTRIDFPKSLVSKNPNLSFENNQTHNFKHIQNSLLNLPIYSVDMESIALHLCHHKVQRSQILAVFNASFCSLCIVSKNLIIDTGIKGCPKYLKETPICESIGLGIVHSIDIEEQTLYVATNVDIKVLEKVNCLLGGDIDLPKVYFLQNNARPVGLPYVDYPKDVIGVSSMRPKGLVVPRWKNKEESNYPLQNYQRKNLNISF